MSTSTNSPHQTRDHRFSYISTGDLTTWCKATTRPIITEPKNHKVKPAPLLDNRTMLRRRPRAKASKPQVCVMVANLKPRKTVDKPEEGSGMVADMIDTSLAISLKINLFFASRK